MGSIFLGRSPGLWFHTDSQRGVSCELTTVGRKENSRNGQVSLHIVAATFKIPGLEGVFTWAALTKCHWSCGLNNGSLPSHSAGSLRSGHGVVSFWCGLSFSSFPPCVQTHGTSSYLDRGPTGLRLHLSKLLTLLSTSTLSQHSPTGGQCIPYVTIRGTQFSPQQKEPWKLLHTWGPFWGRRDLTKVSGIGKGSVFLKLLHSAKNLHSKSGIFPLPTCLRTHTHTKYFLINKPGWHPIYYDLCQRQHRKV